MLWINANCINDNHTHQGVLWELKNNKNNSIKKKIKIKKTIRNSYMDNANAKCFCCELRCGLFQLIRNSSFIFKSSLKLVLSKLFWKYQYHTSLSLIRIKVFINIRPLSCLACFPIFV